MAECCLNEVCLSMTAAALLRALVMSLAFFWQCHCVTGFPVTEWQVRVGLPFQEEPQTDQLDRAVQAQAQEGPVCECLVDYWGGVNIWPVLPTFSWTILTCEAYAFSMVVCMYIYDITVRLWVDGVRSARLCHVLLPVCVLQAAQECSLLTCGLRDTGDHSTGFLTSSMASLQILLQTLLQ